MADPLKNILTPIKDLQKIRGIDLPVGLEFLQLVVTGPPGAGKSYYIEQIGGWPNEGYIDLTQKGWWKDQSLIYRPREVHLGLPFKGFPDALTVFDKEWLDNIETIELEPQRIQLPPVKHHFYQSDWRSRYIFEFLIPRPSIIYDHRLSRQSKGYFPVDEDLSLSMVKMQVSVYREVALYLFRGGLNVYIRKRLHKPPLHFTEKGKAVVPPWTIAKLHSPTSPLISTERWKFFFKKQKTPIPWITPTGSPEKIESTVRVAHDGRSIELRVGEVALRVVPEIALGVKRKEAHKHWVISSILGCSTRTIQGFMRLQVGETVMIGRDNHEYANLFGFDDSVSKRHLSISNHRGDLIITPLVSDKISKIIRLDDLDYRDQLERGRYKALLDIRHLFDRKLIPLPAKTALKNLLEVNAILQAETYRPKNRNGMPGGVIELPYKTTPVIVGDLHARVDNLLKILTENCLLDCLRMKTATLIFLGDTIHSEVAGEMDSFESSMLILDLIFKLKIRFPENVFYLRGNHESFSPEINKNSILQGELFKEALQESRGSDYVAELQRFFDSLAYIIKSKRFIACHGGPPRWKTKRKELININEYPKLQKEIVQNRLSRANHLAGYKKSDIKNFKKALEGDSKCRLIVAHSPLDPFGSHWMNAGSIEHHHVIYSAHLSGPSVILESADNFMPVSFPAEPLCRLINKIK